MASSSAATESQAAQDQLAAAATSLGPRATALYKIYGEALGHTIKSIGYDHFASCFPTPAKYCPDSLRRVWAQMIGRFEELARSEFEDILRERDAVRLLDGLDRLVVEASKRKQASESASGGAAIDIPIAPHTLPPDALLQAHVAPYLAQHAATLKEHMQATQTRNEELFGTVAAQREEVQQLLELLERALGDVDAAVDRLQNYGGRWLVDDIEKMDQEPRGGSSR